MFQEPEVPSAFSFPDNAMQVEEQHSAAEPNPILLPADVLEGMDASYEPREISSTSEPSFEIVQSVTQRGKPKLFEKHGYTFNQGKTFGLKRKYLCSIEPFYSFFVFCYIDFKCLCFFFW